MQQIELSELTIEKIKNKEFEKIIPELYELEEIIENNPWHNNDDVLNHTISVLAELEQVLEKRNNKIKVYLGEKISTHSRKELLFLAALFHDIGKKETFRKENGVTKCPRHEEKGAEKLKKIIRRFDLSENEQGIVMQIVKNHGIIHDILNFPEADIEKQIKAFERECPDIFLEIILLAVADMLASQLKENEPEEFRFRLDSLNAILANYS